MCVFKVILDRALSKKPAWGGGEGSSDSRGCHFIWFII